MDRILALIVWPSSGFWVASTSLAIFGGCCWWLANTVAHNKKIYRTLGQRLGKPIDGSGESPARFRVLSQNMWCTHFCGAEAKGSKGPRVRQRFDAFVRAAVNGEYDVLLLQELFTRRIGYVFLTIEDIAYLTEKLEAGGYIYHSDIVYNLPMLVGQSSGVAIFSRYPIIKCTGHTFTSCSLKEWFNAKGFVEVSVSVGSEKLLHFFSAHLDSSMAGSVKEAQVDQLVRAVSKSVQSGSAILSGDFNICSHSAHNRELFSHLLSYMSLSGMEPIFRNLASSHRSGLTLDHAFLGGGGLSPRSISDSRSVHLMSDVPDLPVSDHDGLAFTIELQS